MLLYVEPGYSTGMTVIPVPMTDQLRYVTSVCVCVSVWHRGNTGKQTGTKWLPGVLGQMKFDGFE